ncbi:helix-turn-helix transcriptional regulator [Nostoc sp. LEGE 06077]|uniref:helix-turn-helix domain-containing protein n=1 Tax=Nostocales TaxID=1161 RepID=UPI00168301CC|nr:MULTISPECIES: helix-turn-helix transcriptional regulator [Nostocales]MBD2302583.1 helix-turn-helix transcriptional regulator [Nostoc sp. FACHB-190]MBD2492218.1 helix-turn-helix transcriptional regulator [Aulosira sp. FACHB-615]MBE9210059.1 helix-turn-helix transcriptional regulator [Nostoc sp. LEGE 06077]
MIVFIALKKLREAAGLSQNDLARKTGYSPQFIQKIEQNKVKSLTLEAAARFCEALDCKPGDLLEEGEPPKKLAIDKGIALNPPLAKDGSHSNKRISDKTSELDLLKAA